MRVLTQQELNRATLARQLLLERRKLSPVKVIEQLVGMQAQSAAAPYIGIWTRTLDFKRLQLERAILRGDVLRPTVMRGTLHFVSKRDYPMLWWSLRDRHFGFGPSSLERALPLLAEARVRAPLTQSEAFAWIGEPNPKHVFRAIRRRGHLLHAPETSLWSPTAAQLFHAVDEPAELAKEDALAQLALRYLRAFGPARAADLAAWSMIPAGWFANALETLPTYKDESGRVLYDVPRGPLPAADAVVPVRLLPKWDNAILGYEKSGRLLPAELRRVVIGQNGDVPQTVLVDGYVAGTWEAGGAVEYLRQVTRTQKAEVADELQRVRAWLSAS
ncbi:MAG TPA: winged helix DNA-binding domain-containing protein [Gaiellaceae bacterium]